ncbi:glutamine synthetase family protein [Candidatus Spongiihabitans sp.]|uniref:glutamine synthetase family protein n=1 Tax=Candidatus Spongiihabitans sp. TaxID=3101308 RepID=UPI003C7C0A55
MTDPLPNPDFRQYLKRHPDTQYVDAMLCDLSCVMRGKRYPIDLADKIFSDGMMLPGSSVLLAVTGDSHDPEGLGFSDGDPDEVAIPIDGTLAPVAWARYPTAQVMLTLQSLGGAPYYFEPRNVLARVLARFGEMGLRPVVAFELEFYLLDPTHDNGERIQPPRSPLSGQRSEATQVYSIDHIEDFSHYLHAVSEACAQQGIATGAISAEYAPGQFEINLRHSDQPLAAADQCVLFRRAVQCVARKHQLQATFMAKPYAARAGSGLHLHISLLNDDGENVFDGGHDDRYGTRACASAQLRHAIGGLKQTMAESMAIFAPNVNSYRRFVANSYVPVSPSWGFENRSVAMRIPKSPGSAQRIEHRVAGADANPYLTLAALLVGIHHGLSNHIDAGQPTSGNAGQQLHEGMPFDAQSAFEKCRRGKILPDYFGQRYLNAYSSCKLKEYQAFTESDPSESSWYL